MLWFGGFFNKYIMKSEVFRSQFVTIWTYCQLLSDMLQPLHLPGRLTFRCSLPPMSRSWAETIDGRTHWLYCMDARTVYVLSEIEEFQPANCVIFSSTSGRHSGGPLLLACDWTADFVFSLTVLTSFQEMSTNFDPYFIELNPSFLWKPNSLVICLCGV